MANRDYILRMIEEFGRFAVALRELILGRDGDAEEIRERLRSAARHAGMDLEMARIASADTIVMMVSPGGDLEPARCWMYAETLYLDGLAARTGGEAARAAASYRKARALFSLIAPHGAFLVGFPEASERIREIDARLAELDDPGGPADGDVRQRRRGPRRRFPSRAATGS